MPFFPTQNSLTLLLNIAFDSFSIEAISNDFCIAYHGEEKMTAQTANQQPIGNRLFWDKNDCKTDDNRIDSRPSVSRLYLQLLEVVELV